MSLTLPGAMRQMNEGRYRAELFRAWHTGLGAGLAHHVSLDQIGRIGSAPTEELRRHLIIGAQQGRSVASLVRARPKLFSQFEAAILVTGDESGTLSNALRLLADYYARDFRQMLHIRSQMAYPIFIGVVASFVLTLPFLHRGGWRPYMAAIGGFFAAFMLMGGLPISILAGIMNGGARVTRARFVRALVTSLEAGLPRGRSLRLAVDSSGSATMLQHVAKRSERDLSTMPLAELFTGCVNVSPDLLSQMAVADATGDYLNTLKRYAEGMGDV